MEIRIHDILLGSRANGPGIRNVVWFQGCSLGCLGCFNPLAHDPKGGYQISVSGLCDRLLDPRSPCEGVTISGGEPFQQPDGLLELIRALRGRNCPPILIFSGYTLKSIREDPLRAASLELTDALICGPYRRNLPPAPERFCSSENQELILLSGRYAQEDFAGLPFGEIIITDSGDVINSGIFS